MSTLGQQCPNVNLFTLNRTCFRRLIQKDTPKVVIHDRRTGLLPLATQKLLKSHYLYSGIGEILIPGFAVPPKLGLIKDIWIPGFYYCANMDIKKDGRKLSQDIIHLSKGSHTFENPTDKPVYFVFVFKPDKAGADFEDQKNEQLSQKG